MNNSRIEILVASFLLFSFIFFLVSYSNYDLRKKRGWSGSNSQWGYTTGRAMDSQGKRLTSVNWFLQRVVSQETNYATSTASKAIGIRENHMNRDEWGMQEVYSQLLFQENTTDACADVKHKVYT